MLWLKSLLGISPVPRLETYRGFGSREVFTVIGRVTDDYKEIDSYSQMGVWANTLQLVRRYLVEPKSGVTVKIEFRNQTVTTTTDKDGFFHHSFSPQDFSLPEESEWIELPVKLPATGAKKKAPVLVEGRNNTFGVISDIDDTILVSKATHKLRFLHLTLTNNAQTRSPFNGVEDFYRALVEGGDGESSNPVFYISSSHWNLYDSLVAFLNVNNIPRGPLLLKRFSGIVNMIRHISDHSHKRGKVRRVLNTYPNLSFILIGDSGQEDTDIYRDIAEDYPDRIKVIYIRDISTKENTAVHETVQPLDATDIVYVNSSKEAAEHAARQGYIEPYFQDSESNRLKEVDK